MEPRAIRAWAVALDVGGPDPSAPMPLLEKRLALLEDQEGREVRAARSAVLARIAVAKLLQGHPEQAFAFGLQAEGLAAGADDPTVWALSQQSLAQILHQVGQLEGGAPTPGGHPAHPRGPIPRSRSTPR